MLVRELLVAFAPSGRINKATDRPKLTGLGKAATEVEPRQSKASQCTHFKGSKALYDISAKSVAFDSAIRAKSDA